MSVKVGERSFAVEFDGPERRLISPATVIAGDKVETVSALWDTGSECTGITPELAARLGLESKRCANLHGVSGASPRLIHKVTIYLPGSMRLPDTDAVEMNISDADIILGMETIGQGEFHVSGNGGRTTFSFRHPPQTDADYVAESGHVE